MLVAMAYVVPDEAGRPRFVVGGDPAAIRVLGCFVRLLDQPFFGQPASRASIASPAATEGAEDGIGRVHKRAAYTHTDPRGLDPLFGTHMLESERNELLELRAALRGVNADGEVGVQRVPQADGAISVDLIAEPAEPVAAQVDCDPVGGDVGAE